MRPARLPSAATLALCLLLAACGGGGGSAPGGGSPSLSASGAVSVHIGASPAQLAAGQPATLSWSSSGTSQCQASGAWSGTQATSGSVAITQATPGTYTYSLSCSGQGGSAAGSATVSVTDSTANMVSVVVDRGPAAIANVVDVINLPFVDVTLCRPGTSICQTVDHVLLDTGSYGLRIMGGVLDAALALPPAIDGKSTGECAQFVSGFLWGSVRRADVRMAGEIAASIPVHQVADPAAPFAQIPADCSATGANLGSVAALGANGILGIGVFNQDCGAACAARAIAGTYYDCGDAGCAGIRMQLADQVANPVAGFGADNNGVAIVMPAVAAGGATTLTGTLIFGVDTQSNNNVGSATVYATSSNGSFTTVYNGRSFSTSFIDSGSNGLFFTDAAIPTCSGAFGGFYCPPAPLTLSAVTASADGISAGTVGITVVNPQALGGATIAASIAGPYNFLGSATATFDWGLPFFFGRTVFVAIEGRSTGHGVGPYWAY